MRDDAISRGFRRLCRRSRRRFGKAAAAALAALFSLLGGFADASEPRAEVDLVIAVGAGGTDAYADQFAEWAERWQRTAEQAGATVAQVGPHLEEAETEGTDDRRRLLTLVEQLKGEEADAPLWLVLIGHGTFQQGRANFNLRGPDVSADHLAKALADAPRPLVIVNCASASGPFLAALSGEGRVVVTATRGGDEQNFARFGDYLSRAMGDMAADLDHDHSVSILEAFLAASAETAQYYDRRGQLTTEHALIDDNGDGRGTPADFFRGIRVVSQSKDDAEPDGRLAAGTVLWAATDAAQLDPQQQQRAQEIETALHELRQRKGETDPDAYYAELEKLMVEMARVLIP